MIRLLGSRLYIANAISYIISCFIKKNETNFNPLDWKVYDLFSGTGIVCESLFDMGFRNFHLNDICYSNYLLLSSHWEMGKGEGCQKLYNYLNNKPSTYVCDWNTRMVSIFEYINHLQGVEGFITEYYTEKFAESTKFYTIENAKMIDAIRQKIEEWNKLKLLNEFEYRYLIGNLIECADEVANIKFKYDSVQKPMQKHSLKMMVWKPFGLFIKNPDTTKSVYFTASKNENYSLTRFKTNDSKNINCVSNLDAEQISIDNPQSVLFLDPPNNCYDYRNLLHLPISIAQYDNPPRHGKANLRPIVQKNNFHKTQNYTLALKNILQHTNSKYIFYFVPTQEHKGIVDMQDIHNMICSQGFEKVLFEEFASTSTDSRVWRIEAPNAKIYRLYCIKR